MTRDQLLTDLKRALDPAIADEVEAWLPAGDDPPRGIARSDTSDLLATLRERVSAAFPDRAERILAAFDEQAGFYLSLAETIQWCSLVIDERRLAASLRTRALWPAPIVGQTATDVFVHETLEQRDRIVRELVEARRKRLKHWPLTRGSRGGGRLALWCPDQSIADGSAELESRGYLDANDGPPWDTWVATFPAEDLTSIVVAWVPPLAYADANAGIDATPTTAVRWLWMHDDRARVPRGVERLDP